MRKVSRSTVGRARPARVNRLPASLTYSSNHNSSSDKQQLFAVKTEQTAALTAVVTA